MYLKKCQIKNFRSIKELDIYFEPNFQILVGLNESGKSNILKALSFLDSEILPQNDDVRDPRHDESPVDEAYVRFIFGLEKNETKSIYNNVVQNFEVKTSSQFIIQIGDKSYSLAEFCDYKKEGLYRANLIERKKSATYWSLGGSHYSIVEGWKKVPDNWEELVNFENKDFKYIYINDYPDYKDSEELEDLTIQELNEVVGKAIISHIDENRFNCIVWKYTESNLLPGRIDIEEFKKNPSISEPLRNVFYLAGYDNIAEAITNAQSKSNGMKNLLRKISDNSTTHLRKVWPEYKKISISFQQNGSVIEAGIEDEFNIYSLNRRSDGFKRFITFLLSISVKVKSNNLLNTLIIIDEPDIGLHPSGIQFLREELIKVASKNYLLVASHSIFMVDKDRIDRHIIVKKEKEETKITSEYSSEMLDEEVIYRALGFSFFELLKKRNIIFEGWSDKYTFQLWLKSKYAVKLKDTWKNLGLLHALGAKDVQRIATHLENFDRQYLIISDADRPSLEHQKKFEGQGKWFTYKDLGFENKETIEDFLNEDYVIKKIFEALKKEQLFNGKTIDKKTTFNQKMNNIFEQVKIDKNEISRIKKSIKNGIYENLRINDIELESLIEKIEIDF